MKAKSAVLILIGLALIAARAIAEQSSTNTKGTSGAVPDEAILSKPGPYEISTLEFTWHDAARNRDVPVKIYCPTEKAGANAGVGAAGGASDAATTAEGPFPVIIFSHGLGGSRDGYAYLGRHWASHGYVSVHPTHIGSDSSLLTGGRPLASLVTAMNTENSINRPKDVSFCIDELTEMNSAAGPLHGKLALDKIGVAGHSYGGYTALAAAGMEFARGPGAALGGNRGTLGDPRIKCAIAMSAPVEARNKANAAAIYGAIKIPTFIMTGTLDDSPIGETKAADRRVPFDSMRGIDHYLLILTGGDHMVFSGRLLGRRERNDDRFQDLVRGGSTAFWDAYLRGDAAAKQWLGGGDFKKVAGADATFEEKPAPAK